MLQIGQIAQANVDARRPWNDSKIDLMSGAKYDFLVPLSEKWNDASIQSDADGYPSPPALKWFERFRRVSDERYFKLIGAIDFDLRDPIRIGTKLTNFVPARSGRLYCLANDLRIMYWNNCGSIEVNVTRTA